MTKIYYFSGTGNSLWSAKKIAEIMNNSNCFPDKTKINCELYNIGIEAEKDELIIEARSVVLIFPSYAYGLPRIVRRFAERAVFKTSYIAAFVTYGSNPGGTLAAMRRILKRKCSSLFFGNIPSVENYIVMFGTPKSETVEIRLAMQEKATEEAARCIIERRENVINTFRPLAAFISLLFNFGLKFFYKYYKLADDCNGCGICERICPVNAIIMQNGRPVFTGKCEHCQGCIDICPLRAIHFGKVKSGTAGYNHPSMLLE